MTLGYSRVTFTEYFIPAIALVWIVGGVQTIIEIGELTPDNRLLVEWDINMSRSTNPDQATVKIYNLHPKIRQTLLQSFKTGVNTTLAPRLRVLLGWGDDQETLFIGEVWNLRSDVRQGEDVITEINFGSGSVALRDGQPPQTPLGSSFAKGGLTLILQYLVSNSLGYTIEEGSLLKIQEKAAALPITTFDNYVVSGDLQDVLDDIIDTLGLEWKIYQNQFVVMDEGIMGVTDAGRAPIMSPQTGLLLYDEADDGTIHFTALAHPRIVPGAPIQFLDANAKPIGAPQHRMTESRFYGSTSGESLVSGVARKSNLI